MKRSIIILILFLLVKASQAQVSANKIPRRSESYFGLHFDFHATMQDKDIGKGLNRDATIKFLRDVKPDYIEVDAKGHNGISSYPTKVGAHPAITGNPLKFYRDITSSLGIALYAHVSGIIDSYISTKHPSWGRLDQSGERDRKNVSIFSPYADSIFIPQLKELCAYGLDGIWIDGDIWSVYADYNNNALTGFTRHSGNKTRPQYGANNLYNDFVTFHEKEYLQYVKRYVDKGHSFKKTFQIGVNGAFTSIMPIRSDISVDYLSVDIPKNKDLATIELQSRFLSANGKPWDVMTWGFDDKGIKSLNLLKKEISSIVALGGGFQLYFTENRNASLPFQLAPLLRQVSSYSRQFQPYCFRSKTIPEIAILYPSQSANNLKKIPFKEIPQIFEPAKKLISLLLDKSFQVEILIENDLKARMNNYPVIFIADWNNINTQTLVLLKQYLARGGKLFVTKTVNTLLKKSNVTQRVTILDLNDKNLEEQIRRVYSSKLVSMKNTDNVKTRAILAKKGTNMVLNVINLSQDNFRDPIEISVRTNKKPASVWLLSQKKKLNFDYKNGQVYLKVPAFDTHDVVLIK